MLTNVTTPLLGVVATAPIGPRGAPHQLGRGALA